MKRALIAILPLLISTPLFAARVIKLPPLTITGTALTSNVTYDASRKVYRYEYTLNAPATNKADIGCFSISLTGRTQHAQVDPDLRENITRAPSMQVQPATMIPVGVWIPDPTGTSVFFGKQSLFSICFDPETGPAKPGTVTSGFILESKYPPGVRIAEVDPNDISWMELENNGEVDDDYE